jgi:hypothetical protein
LPKTISGAGKAGILLHHQTKTIKIIHAMKTQKTLSLLLLLPAIIIMSACEKLDHGLGIIGSGPVKTLSIHLPEFKSIEADVEAQVYLTQAWHRPVSISGQQNILDILDISVENETLRIRYREDVSSHGKLEIFIALPVLEHVSTARGAQIASTNSFGGSGYDFRVYGNGSIEMEVEYARIVRSHITGSGTITLHGSAEVLNVVVNGPGSVISSGLLTAESSIHITGSGICEVYGSNELFVSINGKGKVYYTGNPANIQTQLSGSGELRQLM